MAKLSFFLYSLINDLYSKRSKEVACYSYEGVHFPYLYVEENKDDKIELPSKVVKESLNK